MTSVLDASVLLKWFIEESGSELALDLKSLYLNREIEIIIPDLALYEIPNVLRFKRSIPESQLRSVMQAFWLLDIEIVAPNEALLEEGIHLSFATGLSFYDCSYLALARQIDATLITADRHLFNAASKFVPTQFIH